VAAIQPSAVVYREEQNFDWWVYALVAVIELLAWISAAWFWQRTVHAAAAATHPWAIGLQLGAVVGLVLPAALVVGLLHMTTAVTPTDLQVWFGWVPTYRRVVPVGTIQHLEVVRYRPLADYGGWGVRAGRDGERVLNARGDRGVRLDLSDGTRLLIGSQHPEDLARALERAMQPRA
jgi:hypothetical protein